MSAGAKVAVCAMLGARRWWGSSGVGPRLAFARTPTPRRRATLRLVAISGALLCVLSWTHASSALSVMRPELGSGDAIPAGPLVPTNAKI
jgi:hypothetical protein